MTPTTTPSTSTRRSPVLWTLAQKELSTMFNSPATYVIQVVFLLITGWLFASTLFPRNQSTLESFLGPLPLIFTFVIPALTMRSFAEEFRSGSIEYLATLPLRDHEIVLAKYVAAMGLVGSLLVCTLAYPIILFIIGRPDAGQMIGSYIAIIGLGSLFASIGLWASSLTRNQVVAFIVGFFVCFGFFLLSHIADFFPEWVAAFIRGWGIDTHFEALSRGVLDSRDILYWLSGTFFFLSATFVTLHSRRWR